MRKYLYATIVAVPALGLLIGAGAGTATAAPAVGTGGTGEVIVTANPPTEKWTCFLTGEAQSGGLGPQTATAQANGPAVGGFKSGTTVRAYCAGPNALMPVFIPQPGIAGP